MKRYDSGEALAKDMGLSPQVLKKTFDDYNTSVRTKKDPFGKKVRSSVGQSSSQLTEKIYFLVLCGQRMEAQRHLQRCDHDSRPPLHHGRS